MQKEQVNTRLADPLLDEIDKRRTALDETRGGYLNLIAQWWLAQGAPPVNEYEAHLLEKKKSKSKPGKTLDVWNLNPAAVYELVNDDFVSDLMKQLGVPNLFASMVEHDEIQAVVTFDNHPSHWITLRLFKGSSAPHGDGLAFSAIPKATTSELQMLERMKRDAKAIGANGPIAFSQLPVHDHVLAHRKP